MLIIKIFKSISIYRAFEITSILEYLYINNLFLFSKRNEKKEKNIIKFRNNS